ncbi:MAG TPA: hypothetical protein VKU00_04000 [Chthonomonadaceae bacterium]|nr:hypothetical protein [Chthonomonadaceae bacterium]
MQIDLPLDIFTYPDVPLPEVWTVEQVFDTPALSQEQIAAQVRAAVAALAEDPRLKPGAKVAVGTGSRGLDNLVPVIRTVVSELRARDMEPFIIPAMGSHGGATAEGQIEVLEGYGITQEAVGAELRATMEVVALGTLEGEEAGEFAGHTVWYDRIAHAADAVLLVNRIKAHTDFTGPLESGIGKMAAIGLGKRHGAASIHIHGAHGLRELMPRAARYMAAHANIVGGVALIENELGHTAEIHPLPAAAIAREPEMELLRRAREIAPSLPFDALDVLVIDEMGKNISGAGMDTHVIGRGTMPSIPEHTWGGPDIRLIAVLDLTAPSHGNATALGLADLTTRKLIEKVDWEATLINMRTSGEGGILRGRLPFIMPTSEDCVRTAYATCGQGDPSQVRFARIRSTADTQYLEISAALLDAARSNPSLRVSAASHPLDLCRPVRPM